MTSLIVISLCVAANAASAQSGLRLAQAPAPGRYAVAIETGRHLVDSLMRSNNIPGVSIAVSVAGGVVWSEGFGYANVEQRSPVTAETKFRIGSISKPLTATALAQLYERGALDLDAPVQQYVPAFPEKRWPITVRQVAGHVAGIRHYRGLEFLSSERFETVSEGLEIFENDTLLFEPGTQYSYSTYGWNLLSAVVESAAGEPFLQYMRQHVFQPLGMRNTVADHTDSIIFGRTGYYQRTPDSNLVNAPYVDNSYKWAGGGFLSTPEDLLRFANALLYGDLLKPETVALLWTSQRLTNRDPTNYGIGWRVNQSGTTRVVSHSGGSVGGNSLLLIFPDDGVVLAVASNISGAGYRGVPLRIARKFLGVAPR